MSTSIGNLYKAEVLFLRGINPWQPVGRVADLGSVAELARRLLEANKERIGQVTTGSWRRGEETWVYGRRGRPCRRCGTPIRSEGQQDRITFWCPSCQPADSPRRPVRGARGTTAAQQLRRPRTA
jgi:formamidopyrimidine-DNA glycosylase